MFETLSERLERSLKTLSGRGRLTEDNIKSTLREVRMALLEADVALPVVKEFTGRVRERAVGAEVMRSLSPGQALIKIVREELTEALGAESEGLDLRARPPAVILIAGLQGSGKTTTTAKLARHLREDEKKRVLVVSCDVYRPAAIDQLENVAGQVGVDFHPASGDDKPDSIAREALEHARKNFHDVLIVDTAGRLGIDAGMMDEIGRLHEALDPAETLFVVDAMTGQDAARTAAAFGEALPLTGVILTKVDGDARGGAALSVRHVTGRPIKFLGVGEKLDALEPFHPDRIASRILGMGDVLSLVEDAERKVDRDQAEKLAAKLKKGKGFDFDDLAAQLRQMREMGGIGALMDKLPAGQLPKGAAAMADDGQIRRMLAIVDSMTPHERRFPAVLKASRKRRIAAGSGTQVQDINRLLKQHRQMQKMMKKFSKGGMGKMMKMMGTPRPPHP